MQKILLVEDSIDTQDLVVNVLRPIAHVTVASSLKKAWEKIQEEPFDLVLLDILLDDGDGFSLAAQMKNKNIDIPIIFSTAKGAIEDRVMGFELGAEDYIVKPFDLMEFRVRVESRLKKIGQKGKGEEVVVDSLKLDVPMQKAYDLKDNKNLELTPLQFKILFYLVTHNGRVVSREDLVNTIWGKNIHISRSIDTHINSLRKKMGSMAGAVQSVYGEGYLYRSMPQAAMNLSEIKENQLH